MNDVPKLKVALLGGGTVGAQVAHLLLENKKEYSFRVGADLELTGIAVRNIEASRSAKLPKELFITDAESLVSGADIVIEVMGGLEPARSYIMKALESGADVVTANKALLATHGNELFDAAERAGAQLYFEASVAGAIPILRPLRESLAGDRVKKVMGIVNGTTNFILDKMDSQGASFEDALVVATELGYAEADPTADVDAFDAAQKAAILARLAFHTNIPLEKVHREGIRDVTANTVDIAKKAGYVVKLLAICERIDKTENTTEGVSVRVYPALINREHPLASVHGAHNAVFIEAESAGSLMFYGAGAGGPETASSVLGDLITAARRRVAGGPGLPVSSHSQLEVLPISSISTRYHITLSVEDKPGVLATVAQVFSDHGVSVELVEQGVFGNEGDTRDTQATATLVIGTHLAKEADLAATVTALGNIDAVKSVVSVLRVEGA